jgi:hypothetical protein
MEVAAAAIVLAVMMSVCVQLLRVTAGQRRALEARRAAIQEAANVMERVCARAWEELTPETAGHVQLSEDAERALPGGELHVDFAGTDEEPEGKRITVVLRWPAGPGQPDRSVRLVAWRYRGTAP